MVIRPRSAILQKRMFNIMTHSAFYHGALIFHFNGSLAYSTWYHHGIELLPQKSISGKLLFESKREYVCKQDRTEGNWLGIEALWDGGFNGAPGRNRTGTTVRSRDFKSLVSTNFTTGAIGGGFERQNCIRPWAITQFKTPPAMRLTVCEVYSALKVRGRNASGFKKSFSPPRLSWSPSSLPLTSNP